MTNRLLLKRSNSPGSVPGAGSLEYGELALNYQDGNLFYKNASNTVTVIASNQFLSVVGNITGGNVSVSGNVTGNYILGNGSQLTGLPATYSNANVSAFLADFGSNSISTTGNVTAGYFIGNGALLTGIASTDAFDTIVVPGQANLVANSSGILNIQATGSTNGTTLTTDVANGILNISSTTGDLIFQNGDPLQLGSVSGPATAKNDLGLVTGLTEDTYDLGNFFFTGTWIDNTWIYANSITGNKINSATDISTTGNISAGYFLGNVACASGIFATKIFNGTSEANVVSSNGNITFTIAGASNIAVVDTLGATVTGRFSVSGNVTGGNLQTSGLITAQYNVTGGNLLSAGIASVAGNITGGNLVTLGTVYAGDGLFTGNLTVDGNVTYINIKT